MSFYLQPSCPGPRAITLPLPSLRLFLLLPLLLLAAASLFLLSAHTPTLLLLPLLSCLISLLPPQAGATLVPPATGVQVKRWLFDQLLSEAISAERHVMESGVTNRIWGRNKTASFLLEARALNGPRALPTTNTIAPPIPQHPSNLSASSAAKPAAALPKSHE